MFRVIFRKHKFKFRIIIKSGRYKTKIKTKNTSGSVPDPICSNLYLTLWIEVGSTVVIAVEDSTLPSPISIG
ncbi:hypothetical protein GQ457_07G009800 [Hibiscus cannabinus]